MFLYICVSEHSSVCWIHLMKQLHLDWYITPSAGCSVVCGTVEYRHHLLCIYSVHHTEWDRWPGMILLAPLMHSAHADSLLLSRVIFSRIPSLIIVNFPFGLSEYTCPYSHIQREINKEQIHCKLW